MKTQVEVKAHLQKVLDHHHFLHRMLDLVNVESRPLWKPMHKQPVYKTAVSYTNGISESLFKRGLCLPSGPWVTEKDVHIIVKEILKNIK